VWAKLYRRSTGGISRFHADTPIGITIWHCTIEGIRIATAHQATFLTLVVNPVYSARLGNALWWYNDLPVHRFVSRLYRDADPSLDSWSLGGRAIAKG
jgi:hypothetical protein